MQKKRCGINRPEDGQKGKGFGHRRGEMGGRFWRPPLKKNTSKVALAMAKQKVRVQSSFKKTGRDKGPEVPARPNLHIDDGCMGGGGAITGNDYDDSISGEEHIEMIPIFILLIDIIFSTTVYLLIK